MQKKLQLGQETKDYVKIDNRKKELSVHMYHSFDVTKRSWRAIPVPIAAFSASPTSSWLPYLSAQSMCRYPACNAESTRLS
jgi:hypothetical protein